MSIKEFKIKYAPDQSLTILDYKINFNDIADSHLFPIGELIPLSEDRLNEERIKQDYPEEVDKIREAIKESDKSLRKAILNRIDSQLKTVQELLEELTDSINEQLHEPISDPKELQEYLAKKREYYLQEYAEHNQTLSDTQRPNWLGIKNKHKPFYGGGLETSESVDKEHHGQQLYDFLNNTNMLFSNKDFYYQYERLVISIVWQHFLQGLKSCLQQLPEEEQKQDKSEDLTKKLDTIVEQTRRKGPDKRLEYFQENPVNQWSDVNIKVDLTRDNWIQINGKAFKVKEDLGWRGRGENVSELFEYFRNILYLNDKSETLEHNRIRISRINGILKQKIGLSKLAINRRKPSYQINFKFDVLTGEEDIGKTKRLDDRRISNQDKWDQSRDYQSPYDD